jgi:hypothetical protein
VGSNTAPFKDDATADELGVAEVMRRLRHWWAGFIDLQALLAPSDKRQLVPTQRNPPAPNGVTANLGRPQKRANWAVRSISLNVARVGRSSHSSPKRTCDNR